MITFIRTYGKWIVRTKKHSKSKQRAFHTEESEKKKFGVRWKLHLPIRRKLHNIYDIAVPIRKVKEKLCARFHRNQNKRMEIFVTTKLRSAIFTNVSFGNSVLGLPRKRELIRSQNLKYRNIDQYFSDRNETIKKGRFAINRKRTVRAWPIARSTVPTHTCPLSCSTCTCTRSGLRTFWIEKYRGTGRCVKRNRLATRRSLWTRPSRDRARILLFWRFRKRPRKLSSKRRFYFHAVIFTQIWSQLASLRNGNFLRNFSVPSTSQSSPAIICYS